ncbi:glycosyltransferase family 2 protein [Entomospira nematocerorum]|uniref:Glycosyltransferase family 2 protein n=1 Tax=Entomospira nematocerorum TaxID=2719987 RepID=A0A968KSR5_9SPIO|nr:glycosyltransferase family 2 protein [Entomospira nematocera]NIZ46681.1 glycosyltransferase family 2 protein [Entomospira nematocera]WDI33522.1 glycosyltransferase family 2 protein [Entomospira nematocera]
MIKISVIIPFHNTPLNYFRACLESLRLQNVPECEFILLDDWSTDKSVILAQTYEKKDSRFRYLRNSEWSHNGGARDYGYQHAIGEYVWFVDSDDQLAGENVLSTIIQVVDYYNHPDVVLCDEITTVLGTRDPQLMEGDLSRVDVLATREDVLRGYAEGKSILYQNVSGHNKIFKRTFLLEKQFSCSKRAIHGDLIFPMMMSLASSIAYIHDIAYYVMYNPASIGHGRVKKENYAMHFRLIDHLHGVYLLHRDDYKTMHPYIRNLAVGGLLRSTKFAFAWSLNDKDKQRQIIFELWNRWKTMLPHYPEFIMENRPKVLNHVYDTSIYITDEEIVSYFDETLSRYADEFIEARKKDKYNWKLQLRKLGVLYLPKPLYRWIKERYFS